MIANNFISICKILCFFLKRIHHSYLAVNGSHAFVGMMLLESIIYNNHIGIVSASCQAAVSYPYFSIYFIIRPIDNLYRPIVHMEHMAKENTR